MRKVIAALFFMTLGASLTVFAYAAHVVRSPSGYVVIWKSRPTLKDVYVDVRHWKPRDWNHHRDLAEALQEADHGDLVPQSRGKTRKSFRGFFDKIRGKKSSEPGDDSNPVP